MSAKASLSLLVFTLAACHQLLSDILLLWRNSIVYIIVTLLSWFPFQFSTPLLTHVSVNTLKWLFSALCLHISSLLNCQEKYQWETLTCQKNFCHLLLGKFLFSLWHIFTPHRERYFSYTVIFPLKSVRARDISLWRKHLSNKSEQLSSDSQNTHKTRHVSVYLHSQHSFGKMLRQESFWKLADWLAWDVQ